MVGGRGAGGPVANTEAWQLNKGAYRLQQFLGSHIYTLTPGWSHRSDEMDVGDSYTVHAILLLVQSNTYCCTK